MLESFPFQKVGIFHEKLFKATFEKLTCEFLHFLQTYVRVVMSYFITLRHMELYRGHSVTRRTLLMMLLLATQFSAFAHAGYIESIPSGYRLLEVNN